MKLQYSIAGTTPAGTWTEKVIGEATMPDILNAVETYREKHPVACHLQIDVCLPYTTEARAALDRFIAEKTEAMKR